MAGPHQSLPQTILLLYGGGGTEHQISLISAGYLSDQLRAVFPGSALIKLELTAEGEVLDESGNPWTWNRGRELVDPAGTAHHVDLAIPCIHGPPGETGEIQAGFELARLPYWGSGPEASMICFNKAITKLWLESQGLKTSPWTMLTQNNPDQRQRALAWASESTTYFVKAACQGSSVGCYKVSSRDELEKRISEAFQYSSTVIIERAIEGRELEVAVYEYGGQVHASLPGEILCPGGFYTYDEKYSKDSKTQTVVVAPNIAPSIQQEIQRVALEAFKGTHLRHLARIDFFLSSKNEIFINEINTFPGMTPISMFPKMLENHGPSFKEFLKDTIASIFKAQRS